MKAPANLLVATLTAAGILAAAPAAGSVADNTPPVLTSPAVPSFVVGSQLGVDFQSAYASPGTITAAAPLTFKWSATDASGEVRYDLVEINNAVGPIPVFEDGTELSHRFLGYNDDDDFATDSFEVTARDTYGNAVTRVVRGNRTRLTQENNVSHASRPEIAQPTIAYAGTWGSSACACWTGKAVRRTTSRGASATATVTIPDGGATHLALVMHAGPDRGRFQVFVDGTLRGTVDTYAAVSTPRRIVWDTALGRGTHRVKIVNLATAGRPRIDLDAVLTNGPTILY
ncbi:hypothetical protein [uncultured Nocardioides sp.]|uniref:hypothetical protein n=1 Tax=uncultured Nocardioides sp. TaxID=198441 RepID=UPI0025E31946|nr:hypothetical protein [uncultured Nocardioides sp.]